MKKSLLSTLALIVLACFMLVGCSSQPPKTADVKPTAAPAKLTVGFVYVGPIGDGGWSFAHNEGRLQLEKELGVKTLYKESVPEGPDCEKVMRDMIAEGAKVIFATSFGYMDYVEKVAKDNPTVYFYHCSGYKTAANMSNYFGRMYQARYLSGIVAGMKTKSNKIGYVAAMPIPEVIRMANAFTLGVQSVNPKAKVIVRWTNTWYDPAKEKDAALSLLSQEGVDIIAQHQDTTAPQIAAEEKGAFAIGYNTDSRTAAPKAYLTAPIWNWGPFYVDRVKSVIDGKFKSESYWGAMSTGIVKLADLTSLAPEGAQAKVDAAKGKLADGKWDVFTGPIKDNQGNLKVKDGEVMSDKDMLSMNWFVAGIDGKIEKTN